MLAANLEVMSKRQAFSVLGLPLSFITQQTINTERFSAMENEEWRNVPGYEGKYQVSNFGRVKSLSRFDRYNRFVTEKILVPRKHTGGYLRVQLSRKDFYIHRLVAEAFIPKVHGKEQINHKDMNKQNNCVDNLEWCTQLENNQHSYQTRGLTPDDMSKMAKHPRYKMRKLTPGDVFIILEEYHKGTSDRILASRFGVNRAVVWQITRGKSYKEVFDKWRKQKLK